jgi:2-polyprenyl-6-methoxyphenol hydroxylase-like FAD-dependent oxidoreductase
VRNNDVLISGAGVAGQTLALWLRRFGFNPVVVERAPAPRDGGQAVDLRGAAIEVARRTGILDAARAARTRIRGMSYVSSTGKRLASLDGAFGVIDPDDVEIVRGDLAGILHEAARDDVEYVFDDSIASLAETADGVTVTFERSAPRTFGLVAGADGLHSRVRALAFGPESRFTSHLGLYLSVFTIPNDLELDHWQLIYVTPGRSVTVTSARDNREARAIFFFASEPLSYDHHDRGQQQELLTAAFAGAGWEVPGLLTAMRTAPDFYFDSVSQVRMDRWSTGRVTLVGDAGYCPSPLSGQGSSLALVGAYVLASELRAADGDHRAAYARYQERMAGFVARNQQIAIGNAKRFTPASRRQIWLQNQGIKILPYMPGKNWVLSLATRGVKEAATAITLPDPGIGRGGQALHLRRRPSPPLSRVSSPRGRLCAVRSGQTAVQRGRFEHDATWTTMELQHARTPQASAHVRPRSGNPAAPARRAAAPPRIASRPVCRARPGAGRRGRDTATRGGHLRRARRR